MVLYNGIGEGIDEEDEEDWEDAGVGYMGNLDVVPERGCTPTRKAAAFARNNAPSLPGICKGEIGEDDDEEEDRSTNDPCPPDDGGDDALIDPFGLEKFERDKFVPDPPERDGFTLDLPDPWGLAW